MHRWEVRKLFSKRPLCCRCAFHTRYDGDEPARGSALLRRRHRPAGTLHGSLRPPGPGIPAADLPFIFEEFRQVEGEEKEGTGLGLSIAKKSIELLGGTISAESEVGEGTTFTLRIGGYETPD